MINLSMSQGKYYKSNLKKTSKMIESLIISWMEIRLWWNLTQSNVNLVTLKWGNMPQYIGSAYYSKNYLQLNNNPNGWSISKVFYMRNLKWWKLSINPIIPHLGLSPSHQHNSIGNRGDIKKVWAWLTSSKEALLGNHDKIRLSNQWEINYLNEKGVCLSVTSNAW